MLRGETVAHVRILYVVARRHAPVSTHLSLHVPRLWTFGSSFALIIRLGATPIYTPFRPQCNFMVSIIKRPPALELFFRGAYIILEIMQYMKIWQMWIILEIMQYMKIWQMWFSLGWEYLKINSCFWVFFVWRYCLLYTDNHLSLQEMWRNLKP